MTNSKIKVYIGFIAYGEATARYLPYFLPSLKNQSFKDFKIEAIDNSLARENDNAAYIRNNFPEIDLTWSGENLGFARAFNRLIDRAMMAGAEYFLALNPDMVFEENFVEAITAAMESDEKIGAVAPVIFKWDFAANKKTDQIDSLGLALDREHRFFDAHQGESGRPANIGEREVFGFTGAAVLLRLKALADVAFDNGRQREYFDELMFMYKEDCDLSYRLRLAGWKIILAPEAVAYHNRAVAARGRTNLAIALNRKNKSRPVKQWSFLNQWILLCKFKKLPLNWRIKLATAWYQIKSLIFVLFFESFLLKELIKLWKIRPEIDRRRRQLKIRIDLAAIEKFMN